MATPLSQSIALLADRVFGDTDLEALYVTLTKKWDRYQSLQAAMKLMEQHGVMLTEEEETHLSEMDERSMIESLVQKMPMNDKAQFQQFFLQLQIIVSTATKVRQALEASRPDLVQAALDEAESTGMSSYILKMAVVAAGYEVVSLKQQHEAWVKESEHKMAKLVRGQEDAMKARKKLAQAQLQLNTLKSESDKKTKGVLMNLAGGTDNVLKQGAFAAWRDATKQEAEEREIYQEFKERIEQVEAQLLECKTRHLRSITGVVNRKYQDFNTELLKECMATWKDDIASQKFFRENESLISDLEGKLKEAAEQQHSTIQKLVLKMFGDSEAALIKMVWQGFLAHHHEYQRNKDMEDQVKQMEKRVQGRMDQKAGGTKSVLTKMSGAYDAATMQTHFVAWLSLWKDAKEEAAMAEKLAAADSKFGNFGALNKGRAKDTMERQRVHQEQSIMMTVLYAWRTDIKVEMTLRNHTGKIEGKKAQLQKVQHMFRDFAAKLETGIKSNQDSERDFKEGARMHRPKKQMMRADGSISLPDIHSGKGPPQQPPMMPDRPRSRDRSTGRSGRHSNSGREGGPPPVPPTGYGYPDRR